MIIDAVNKGPEESLHLVEEHWKDLLLQYIGLLTAVIVGLLLAILLPIIGGISFLSEISNSSSFYYQDYLSVVAAVQVDVESIQTLITIRLEK